MFKRVMSVVAAAVLLISSSGLEQSKGATDSSEKQVTISFYNTFKDPTSLVKGMFSVNEAKFSDYAIKKFEQENPGIHIREDSNLGLESSMGGEETKPDVALAWDYYAWAYSEEVCDLNSIAAQEKSNLIASTLQESSYEHKQVGIPFAAEVNEFVYNKNMIKKAPKDFDDLISMAKGYTKNGVYGLNMNITDSDSMLPWISEFGEIGYKDVKRGTTTFADKGMIDYFKVIEKIAKAQICPKYYSDTMFENGKAAFSYEEPFELDGEGTKLGSLDAKLNGNYAVIPAPSMNKNSKVNPYFKDLSFFVTKNSKYKKEAEKFIKFMVSKEVQDKFKDFHLHYIPVNKKVDADANLKVLMKEVENSGEPYKYNVPYVGDDDGYREVSEAIERAYTNAVNNILDLKLNAENAAKQAYNEVLTEVSKYFNQKINKNDLYKVNTTVPQITSNSNKNNKNIKIKWKEDNSSYFFKDKTSGGSDVNFINNLGKMDLKKYLTRNDFAKLLWELYFKQKNSDLKMNPFKDVNTNDEFANYILAAKDYMPYYKEKDGNYFKGSEQITREAAITTLLKISGCNVDTKKLISDYNFSDEKDISKELVPYMVMALENKWIDIKSYSNKNYLCPKAPLTLEDLSKLLQGVYEILNPGNYKASLGNSFANICSSNFSGIVSQSGNKIFFGNYHLGDGLFEANEYGTGIKKLLNGSVQCINCEGDWIYCVLDDSKICKIKNDGTMEKVIYSGNTHKYQDFGISNMIRIKDKLYFCECYRCPTYDVDALVSINLDGTGRKIVSNNFVYNYTQLNDYIYYINGEDSLLYRMKIDGTSVEKISDEFKELKNLNIEDLYSAGGNLIVSVYDNDYKTKITKTYLYAIDMNNHILSKVGVDSNAKGIQFEGNKFYYCSKAPSSVYNTTYIFTADPITNKACKFIDDPVCAFERCTFNIVGDWMYYVKVITQPDKNGEITVYSPIIYELWRIKLDGTKNQRLSTEITKSANLSGNIVSNADKLYISKKVKSFSNNLTMQSFSQSSDSKECGNTMGNILCGGIAAEYGGYIYYGIDNNGVYKISADSKNSNDAIKLSYTSFSSALNVLNGNIYYSDGYIEKISLDRGNDNDLQERAYNSLVCQGEYIYYVSEYDKVSKDSYCLFKMKNDGSEKVKLSNDRNASIIGIKDDWIYYCISAGKDDSVYRIKTDGSAKEKIEEKISKICAGEDGLYYLQHDNVLYKMNFDGSSKERLFALTEKTVKEIGTFNLNNGWIYYISNNVLGKIKIDGTNNQVLYKHIIKESDKSEYNSGEGIEGISVCGNWVYFQDLNMDKLDMYQNGSYDTCRIGIDGSGFENLSE